MHGSRSWDPAALRVHLPAAGYDSASAETRVNVTLHCADAACASGAANNGFLLLAYDAAGAPAGRFTHAPAGARPCGAALRAARGGPGRGGAARRGRSAARPGWRNPRPSLRRALLTRARDAARRQARGPRAGTA